MFKKEMIIGVGRVLMNVLPFGRTATDIFDLVGKINRSQKDIDKQVEEAVGALSRSSELIGDLEGTLKERTKKLQELKVEYDRVSTLASLTRKQGEAVAAQLEQTLGRDRRKERLIAFVISVIAGLVIFVVGVFTSDWVRSIPTMLSPPS